MIFGWFSDCWLSAGWLFFQEMFEVQWSNPKSLMSADVHAAAHASKHQGFGAPAETVNKFGLLMVKATLLPVLSFLALQFQIYPVCSTCTDQSQECELLESDRKNIFTPKLSTTVTHDLDSF